VGLFVTFAIVVLTTMLLMRGTQPAPITFLIGSAFLYYLTVGSRIALLSALPFLVGFSVIRRRRMTKISGFILAGVISFILFALPILTFNIFVAIPQESTIPPWLLMAMLLLFAALLGAVAGSTSWYYLSRSGAFERLIAPEHPETNF